MSKHKLTVVMEAKLLDELRRRVPQKKRSRFICDAVSSRLKLLRDEELKQAYSAAFDETKAVSDEWDGLSGDGID